MTDDTKEWVTVKVPKRDREDAKAARPDSATFGDCLVAGAKLLSGGEGVEPAPVELQSVETDGVELPDAETIADELVGRIGMASDPGAPMTDGDVAELAEQVRQLQRMVERVPEDTADALGERYG